MSAWGEKRTFVHDQSVVDVVPLIRTRPWVKAMPTDIVDDVWFLGPSGDGSLAAAAKSYIGREYKDWLDQCLSTTR